MPSEEYVAPLSFAQEELWYLEQLRGGRSEHVMTRGFRLRGRLDPARLVAALGGLAARHEILRTRYGIRDGVPVQLVGEPGLIELTELNLCGLTPAEVAARLRAVELSRLSAPFDLAAAAPWRAVVARSAPEEAVLLLAVHHIAFDGGSWPILMADLAALYEAAGTSAPPRLPVLDLQYADHAEWQRERWADDPGTRARLDHWRNRLSGLQPLELPANRPRPAIFDPAGAHVDAVLPAEVVAALARLARTRGATTFMVYLAGFQLLLARWCGRRDIAVGVSVDGRGQPELEGLVGLFVDTVVMRTDLSGDLTTGGLVDRVRATVLDAFDHGDVPFGRVVAELAPERDLSRNPLFQAGFALNGEPDVPAPPGLSIEPYPMPSPTVPFDLSLYLFPRADGAMLARLSYPTALFDPPRIERMATGLVRLLSGFAAGPDTRVGAVDVLASPERRRITGWGRGEPAPAGPSLTALVAAQARLTPDAPAVVSDAGTLCYAELVARVERLAGHLTGLGVGAPGTEVPVGVALNRGPDLAIALLAVLAAGGVWQPLPSEHPAERLASTIADTGVTVLLAEAALRDRLPAGLPVVLLDAPGDAAGGPPLRPAVAAEVAAAYAITTSGSTGRPKVVIGTQGGLRNRVLWAVQRCGLTAGDRVLHRTSTGFDASLWEILAPLVSGGAVVMAPPDTGGDPAAIAGVVARHHVTVLQLVPSLLGPLAAEPTLDRCRSLRLVSCGGEPLPAAVCGALRERLDVQIVNTYGPTECSVDVTAADYRPADPAATVPIGAPLPGTTVYVVDPADGHDALVPVGVPGELCVAGTGVARGYAGRGDLTAERFAPNPHAAEPGERWYRTGDLVRWREDGMLEFLGRVDRQVKVRGVRVEPAEVEAALLRHPAVVAAVVTAHRSGSGDMELVAYAVPATGASLPVADLRAHLGALLPAVMVPSHLVALDALPRTPSGKTDLDALPPPVPDHAPASSGTAPRTPTEQLVTELLAEVLSVASVGVGVDFFAAGGHSLAAIRLTLRLRSVFGVEVGVLDVVRERTAERLAAFLDAAPAGRSGGAAGATPVPRVPRDGTLRLSPGQRRLWFLDGLHGGGTEYLLRLRMRLRGPWDPSTFRRAVEEVVRRHEVLRTRYTEEGSGDPVQVIDPPGPADVTVVDIGGVHDAARRALALLDEAADRPFDLRREHPLRALVVRTGSDEHLLAITLHHIAVDAWSCDVLLRDLERAYHALAAGGPAALPALPVQYADVAAWQLARAGAAGSAARAYWRDRLAGLDPVVLAGDRPRDTVRDQRGDVLAVDVPRRVARLVDAAGERHGTTAFETLLAAFQVLLARRTGRTDIAVGTPVSGRAVPGTEDLIGFFVNTVVLRTDLAGGLSFAELLERVRRVVKDATAHDEVPFEDVVAEVRPSRDAARNPLFEVMFQVEHSAGLPATFGGATVEPLNAGACAPKVDLVVTVRRTPEGDLRCVLEYAGGLFDRLTMRQLADDYVQLLERLAGEPDAPALDPGPAPVTLAAGPVPSPAPEPDSEGDRQLAGQVQEVVARIWSAVLGIDDVGADDDFFDLGGHSLMVSRVRAQLRRTFAVEIPLQVLYEATTVAGLADAVAAAVRADVDRLSDSQVQDVITRAGEGSR